MGFLSTKSKVRKYIETYLPILSKYPKILRQWTLRYSEPLQPPVQFKKIITPKRIQYPIPIINPPVPTDIPNLSISCTEIDSINSHDINFYDDFPNDNKDQMINEYSFTSFNDSQTTFEWDMSEKENSSLSLQSEFNDEPTIDYQND
ncbi:hypothetical protein GPJ56_003723 [Histomonas meleagridis]|uniref:uncharacterized protein n=1 Tax=Histomonas meleagridis TaxID=135588 RepID=UPI003559EC11|nr:hypothetical protein GPJ56_003723 [Histomonas meleagridis]KAH0800559.1 hypothetical protein GO595_006627 [Histomonas meleagridis]